MLKILVYPLLWGVHTKKAFDAQKASYKGNNISPRVIFAWPPLIVNLSISSQRTIVRKVLVAQHVIAMFTKSSYEVTKSYISYYHLNKNI